MAIEMIERRKSRVVKAGNVKIGGKNPITVQSMLNVPAHDKEGNVRQAVALEKAGCEIIRLTVPDREAVNTLFEVKNAVNIPVVADIHFDYRCALESVSAGADKIRINPGNIGDEDKVRAVAEACRLHGVPIRIGVNSGSLEKELLEKYGSPTPEAMAESAMRHIALLEKNDFNDIVVSIKSSDVQKMVKAYRLVAEQCDYPLHLGVTEAGTQNMALVKSSIGIGSLLLDGIGDTIRVSMTADPVNEVKAGFDILKAAGIKTDCVQIVSCPTCGRTKINLIELADKIERALADVKKPLKVAVMGCVVNGPGEAREADIGVAGGDGCGVLFKNGEVLKKVPEAEIIHSLLEEINKM
ncbi:MAG: flavodoxin-dependent (E)-4-hydroxy-3-methylbut-2-enyl-diphosphate synthase [Candidatus Fimenecus sp.]